MSRECIRRECRYPWWNDSECDLRETIGCVDWTRVVVELTGRIDIEESNRTTNQSAKHSRDEKLDHRLLSWRFTGCEAPVRHSDTSVSPRPHEVDSRWPPSPESLNRYRLSSCRMSDSDRSLTLTAAGEESSIPISIPFGFTHRLDRLDFLLLGVCTIASRLMPMTFIIAPFR